MTKSHHKDTATAADAATDPATDPDTVTPAPREIAPFLTRAPAPPHRPQNVGVVRAD
jgi:hypothetical protein